MRRDRDAYGHFFEVVGHMQQLKTLQHGQHFLVRILHSLDRGHGFLPALQDPVHQQRHGLWTTSMEEVLEAQQTTMPPRSHACMPLHPQKGRREHTHAHHRAIHFGTAATLLDVALNTSLFFGIQHLVRRTSPCLASAPLAAISPAPTAPSTSWLFRIRAGSPQPASAARMTNASAPSSAPAWVSRYLCGKL